MKNEEVEKWHRHLGVYGICINEKNEMLLIEKNGGPYTGLYDLPGGSLENPESLVQCLKREILEETGYNIGVKDNLGSYDFVVNSPYNGFNYTHHIALMYSVYIKNRESNDMAKYVYNQDELDENDSVGEAWININDLSDENASPLVVKACELIKNKNENLYNISEYLDLVK